MPYTNNCEFCPNNPILTFSHASSAGHKANIAKVTAIRRWWTFDDATLKKLIASRKQVR